MWVDAGEEQWDADEWTAAESWDTESWAATSDGWQEVQWSERPSENLKETGEDTILVQLRAAEEEAANLYNEAQISLQQAREAVAEARKDRGFGDSVQQGQSRGPPTFVP